MTVRYEEILGTTANDTIVDGCGFVTLGLQGNDTINGIVGDNQLCLGGTGANTYNLVQSDIMTVVSINGGSDTIVALSQPRAAISCATAVRLASVS